ncbi:hypothetical protein FSHL1_009721 [Fusarium sambucinum]
MSEHLTPWSPVIEVTSKVKIDDLQIAFKRTVLVPDGKTDNYLPPDLGEFPMHKVEDYAEKLPLSTVEKGGIFIPMYELEALWISFESIKRYAIRVFVGGINVVSGEPKASNAAKRQDYLVVPDQYWIDGIAVEPGRVRQFMALPPGSRHSIEKQVTGEDVTGGIQFEIARLDEIKNEEIKNEEIRFREIENEEAITLIINSPNKGGSTSLKASRMDTIADLKARFEAQEKVPAYLLRFSHGRRQLEDDRTLKSYGLPDNAFIQTASRLRGGVSDPCHEMRILAGGRICQGIVALPPKRSFSKTVPVTFNVQVLDFSTFERVTGKTPHECPTDAYYYARCGKPFFVISEELSTICGEFAGVKSYSEAYGYKGSKPMPVNMGIMDIVTRQVHSIAKRELMGIQEPETSEDGMKIYREIAAAYGVY